MCWTEGQWLNLSGERREEKCLEYRHQFVHQLIGRCFSLNLSLKEEVMRLWTVCPVGTSDRNSLALAAGGNLLCNYSDLESDSGAAFTSRPLIDSITRQL